jgi:phosphoribosylpyrophosphate synthetase
VIAETVTCISFRRDVPNPWHDLLRAFRAGHLDAFAQILAKVRQAVAPCATRLFAPGTIAVAVPGHRAGSANAPCDALIRALAAEFPNLIPGPGMLIRVQDAPEAKVTGWRDPSSETATLRWAKHLVPVSVHRVLLVDDVLHSGATLNAASMALPTRLASSIIALAVFHATSG